MSRQLPRSCQYRGQPKVQFPTEQAAMDHASRGDHTPYHCSNCGTWHLGKTAGLEKAIRRVTARSQPRNTRRRARGAWS